MDQVFEFLSAHWAAACGAAAILALIFHRRVMALALRPIGDDNPTPLIILVYAGLAVLFSLLLTVAFAWHVLPALWSTLTTGAKPADAIGQVQTEWGQFGILVVGLVAAISIPLVLYRAHIQTISAKAAAQSALSSATDVQNRADAAKKANISDRILKATELLGATTEEMVKETVVERGPKGRVVKEILAPKREPNIEVRLGAIYTLESVAKESLDDHWSIMQTLLAYIRKRRGHPDKLWAPFIEAHGAEPAVPERQFSETEEQEAARKAAEAARKAWRAKRIEWIKSNAFRQRLKLDMHEDVLAAINALRFRNEAQLTHELGSPPEDRPRATEKKAKGERKYAFDPPNRPFELEDTPLFGADLRGADFRRQHLVGAALSGANLERAKLEGANLERAELEGASLRFADLEGANLRRAELGGAHLGRAKLEGADLRDANLEGAILFDANLERAILVDANLERAILVDAKLEGADLRDANLEGAILFDANLEGANLLGAKLEGANLRRAELGGANLASVSLTLRVSADHSGCANAERKAEDGAAKYLIQEQIDAAFGDNKTAKEIEQLGLQAPDHWASKELDGYEAYLAWRAWRKKRGLDSGDGE